MGKMTGVFTQIRGKVGNTIFQVLNGEQIVKTFAIPSNPESSGQTAQRGVFADIIAGFKTIANSVIGVFWNPFVTSNKTGWGNFISKNLLSMGKVAFDITKAILSYGSLERISTLSATYASLDGEVIVTLSDDDYTNGATDDEVSIVAFDNSSGIVVGKFLAEDTRGAGSITVNCPAGLTATDIEIFAICSQDGFIATGVGLVSTSDNCTCTAPA